MNSNSYQVCILCTDVQNVLSQKHPVSAFMEYAQARRWKADFVEMPTSGPAHCKRYCMNCSWISIFMGVKKMFRIETAIMTNKIGICSRPIYRAELNK